MRGWPSTTPIKAGMPAAVLSCDYKRPLQSTYIGEITMGKDPSCVDTIRGLSGDPWQNHGLLKESEATSRIAHDPCMKKSVAWRLARPYNDCIICYDAILVRKIFYMNSLQ